MTLRLQEYPTLSLHFITVLLGETVDFFRCFFILTLSRYTALFTYSASLATKTTIRHDSILIWSQPTNPTDFDFVVTFLTSLKSYHTSGSKKTAPNEGVSCHRSGLFSLYLTVNLCCPLLKHTCPFFSPGRNPVIYLWLTRHRSIDPDTGPLSGLSAQNASRVLVWV